MGSIGDFTIILFMGITIMGFGWCLLSDEPIDFLQRDRNIMDKAFGLFFVLAGFGIILSPAIGVWIG